MDIAVLSISWIAIAVGLAGTIVPILPGTPLMLAGMVMIAWVGAFKEVGWGTLSLLLALTIVSIVVDVVASMMGAKRVNASPLALVGAAIGTIVGLFFGLVGVFICPFIGAVAGEFITKQDLLRAGTVGAATWMGLIVGAAAKLALACMMVGVFLFFYFF
ncbi:MAG: DUF456 domain-containing protein [Oligoflexia bacterium]|nr:DUF456 domain-containing protein [Oligoflexia bacterium]